MESYFPEIRLPDLTAEGTPREIGLALGRHAAHSIQHCLSHRLTMDLRQWGGTARLAAIVAAGRFQFPEAYLELEGLADGADVNFNDIVLLNCAGDLPLREPLVDSGCTTLMVPGDRNASLPALILHNEDAALTAPTPWFLARIRPAGKPAFTSFCYAGKLPGTAFSVTDCGLVQTINDVRPLEPPVGAPRVFLARTILGCESSDAALSLIRSTQRAGGYHHAIGCAGDGRLYSVEAPGAAVISRDVTQSMAHSNHFNYAPLRSVPQHVVAGSWSRQMFADEQLNCARSSPILSLRTADSRGRTLFQLPSLHNAWHKTLATAAFELQQRGVSWRCMVDENEDLVSGQVTIE